MRDRWICDELRMDLQRVADVTNPKRQFRHAKSSVMSESAAKAL